MFCPPLNEHSPWKFHWRDIGEKAKQNSARNNAKCSKCFQFLCNNSDRTWFFNALIFARSLGRCWKPQPSASVFNTFHGTWWMLMHEKPCLIPILSTLYVQCTNLLVSLSRLSMLKQQFKIDSMSVHWINVKWTLFWCCVPTGSFTCYQPWFSQLDIWYLQLRLDSFWWLVYRSWVSELPLVSHKS